jgi:hypothetical protein
MRGEGAGTNYPPMLFRHHIAAQLCISCWSSNPLKMMTLPLVQNVALFEVPMYDLVTVQFFLRCFRKIANSDYCLRHFIPVCLSVGLSVCPSVRPSVPPSVRPSVCVSVRPSVGTSVHLSSVRPSVRLSVCPSVRPHGTALLPPDRSLWHFIFEYFSKIRQENSSFI